MTSHCRRRLGREWWKAARALAMLALLAHALLLPALHRASGGAPVPAVGIAASHHHHTGHGDGDERQGGTNQQVCHFCRLLEAALPKPLAEAAELSFLGTAEWAIRDDAVSPPKSPHTTKLPRAPPPRA